VGRTTARAKPRDGPVWQGAYRLCSSKPVPSAEGSAQQFFGRAAQRVTMVACIGQCPLTPRSNPALTRLERSMVVSLTAATLPLASTSTSPMTAPATLFFFARKCRRSCLPPWPRPPIHGSHPPCRGACEFLLCFKQPETSGMYSQVLVDHSGICAASANSFTNHQIGCPNLVTVLMGNDTRRRATRNFH
jgi:hypothetical protein